ncbi:hypothetical protein [Nocardioides sp. W7]|uniref:hypothetical protein n=1 Tax=Nocardioides sp. W7 TaxID=2931390 RepID=UPI001FD54CCD|nr:hypothetical protein [Nocardioides sp. W7]
MIAASAIDVCTEYNLPLAVEDFVPVILAGAAFVILAGAVRARIPRAYGIALAGGLLVTLGGLAKATWKTLVASGCWDYPILENLLFPCIAGGFAAVAWAAMSMVKGREVSPWPYVLFPAAAGIGAAWMSISSGSYENWPLLIAAAVGASVLGITLAVAAFKAGKTSVGVLLVIYTVGTNCLPPLAAQPDQSLELQWGEQLTNSAVQLCFLLSALWLREHFTRLGPASTRTAAADDTTGVTA